MKLFAIPSLIALIANICLGLVIFSNKNKSKSNQILFLLVVSVGIATLGEFMQRNSVNPTNALAWAKFSFFGMVFLPSIFLHFTYLFPKVKNLKIYEFFYIYFPAFIFSGFLTTDYLIIGVYKHYLGYSVIFGKYLPYFIGFVLIYIYFGIQNILQSYYGSYSEKKYKDTRYIIVSLLVFFVGAVITKFFPSKFDGDYFPITSSLGIVAIIFMAYSIIIYKFSVMPVAFESVANNIQDGIVVFDSFGQVIKVNSSACKMLGIEKESIGKNFNKEVYKTISNLKKPNIFKELLYQADLNQKEIVEGKISTKEPERVLDIAITSIHGKGAFIFGKIVILHDVTKKEMMEKEILTRQNDLLNIKKELEITNNKLIEANRLKSEFVSIVSHDLGTPMTVMKGNLELLSDETLGIINDNQKKALKLLSRNIEQLNFLRKDTLDLSQMDLGKMTINRTNVYLYSLIETTISDLMALAEAKNQQITTYIPKDIIVYCDKNKIFQAVNNYISNAIKYTQIGGEIFVVAKEDGDFIDLMVIDNGRGIPESELENVFKRFYKVGPKVMGSTGLGLAIVKGIIEAHGGKVYCESEEGEGSTFHFTLPKNSKVIKEGKKIETIPMINC